MGEGTAKIKPLFTMVGTMALNRPTQVIEIEMDAGEGEWFMGGEEILIEYYL